MEGNLTKGPILKTLTKLAIPIMASSFLGTLYNITDMAWVGLLGSKAVAGIGVGGMFTWLSQGFASMARMGGQVQVAQCVGRGDKEKAHGYAQAAVQLATVTAQFIVMSIMILGIVKQKKENVLKGITLFTKIPAEYLNGICKIGIPTAIQGMAYCVISMVITRMVSAFGAEAIATQRVGGQIESISWNTADGFATALNAFIAQNYGAGEMGRVKKGYRASQWTVGIWGIFITLLFVCVPRPIANIFFHEPKAIATAVDYLIIVGFSEAFLCIETTTVGALSGLGRTHLCSVISIIFTSARIPLAIILGGTSLGLNGIWWALSSTSIVKGVLFVIVFQWVTRTKKQVAA